MLWDNRRRQQIRKLNKSRSNEIVMKEYEEISSSDVGWDWAKNRPVVLVCQVLECCSLPNHREAKKKR